MPAYDLKAAVTKIKTKRLNFALYKGTKDNQMLITAQPAKPKQIAAMEEEIGEAKRIAKGVCFWENDQLTFATKNTPQPIWETMATKIFKANECAKFLPVIFRQLKEDESDEAAETEEEEVAAGVVPPPPPPPPAANKPEAGNDLEAQWKALKSAMYPDIKKALEGAPANRDEILKLAGEATRAEKAGDFATAIAHFETLRPLLSTIPAAPPPPPVDLAGQYKQRLAGLMPRLKEALTGQLGDTGKMRAVAAFAQEKAGAQDFTAALKALDALEKLLGEAGGAAAGAAAAADGFSKVKFEQIHLDWDSRKKEIHAALMELHGEIVDEFDDPETASAAKNLDKVLARFNEGLGDTLDELRNAATKEARTQIAGKANGITDRYLAYLSGDPLVAHVEANPYEIEVKIKDTLSGSLTGLKSQLAPLLA